MSRIDIDRHAPITAFEVDDGCLCVGGRRVTDIVSELGSPLYLYDRSLIEARVALLREALPREVHLHYAVKANPRADVVALLAGLTDGLDVASARELQIALDAGGDPAHISFAGPGKRDDELAAALAAGIVVNIESPRELDVLATAATGSGTRPRVAVRVNPPFQLRTSGMKMGGGPQQFGIDAEKVPEVLAKIRAQQAEFVGFHIFSGSQNLRPEAIIEAQQLSVDLAIELARSAPDPVRLLNIGGGFGVPYFPGETPLDLEPIAKNLSALVARVDQALPQARLTLELGRYFVAEAGVYLCRIIERKESRGQVFLITDGGLHHHLAASGNFGQVIRKNYPVVIANRVGSPQTEVASVVGPLCTPLDLLADRMELARADAGDLVAVFQSGAYGLTASPLGFLSHPPPGEALL